MSVLDEQDNYIHTEDTTMAKKPIRIYRRGRNVDRVLRQPPTLSHGLLWGRVYLDGKERVVVRRAGRWELASPGFILQTLTSLEEKRVQ